MTEVKRHVEIAGYGICLPKHTVQFKDQTRYRVVENEETQLDLAEGAIHRALEHANLDIKDIDCLVSASAVGVQPIPCTAALIHERVAKGLSIPAMDINTTCTSFISALIPSRKKVLNSLVMGQQPLFSKKVIRKKGSLLVSNVLGQKGLTIRRFVEV